MHATLIQIGNSQGIRIPKVLIEQLGLGREIDLQVKDGCLMLRPAHTPRADWAEAAAKCHDAGEDDLPEWDATIADFAKDCP